MIQHRNSRRGLLRYGPDAASSRSRSRAKRLGRLIPRSIVRHGDAIVVAGCDGHASHREMIKISHTVQIQTRERVLQGRFRCLQSVLGRQFGAIGRAAVPIRFANLRVSRSIHIHGDGERWCERKSESF